MNFLRRSNINFKKKIHYWETFKVLLIEMPVYLKTGLIVTVFLLSTDYVISQSNPLLNKGFKNTILTAVPFLTMDANAQSAAMGSIGVVSSDLYAQNGLNQNPALLARGKKTAGFQAINYVPWLRHLVPNLNLVEAGYYQSLSKNNCIAVSFKSFSYGELQFTDDNGNPTGKVKPIEMAVGLKYAHNISKNFSMGAGIKYIHSDLTSGLTIGNLKTHSAKAIAVEIGADYRLFLIEEKDFKLRLNLGVAALDIGNKVNYVDNQAKDFLPQTLKIGSLLTFIRLLQNENYFAWDIQYQASKLLVPSPPIFSKDGSGNLISDGKGGFQIERGMNPNVNSFQAIIQSFHDAPGGGTEEFREIVHQLGAETRLNFAENKLLLAFRAGYFAQHFSKGNQKRITTGVGFGYAGFMIDLAYILPTTQQNILEKTLFISFGARFNLNKQNFFKFKEF